MSQVTFYDDVRSLREKLAGLVQPYSTVFILCDENTEDHCLPLITDAIDRPYIIGIRSGEQYKALDTCATIWSHLTAHHADRNTLLINLGGGVICDMGGFAASCYKRGIDFIHIPTTLLAMVDASVGGKTGIDFHGYKNQIGLFSEALEVLICPEFLASLGQRQIRSGFAEVIKHYLIADAGAFHALASEESTIAMDRSVIEKAVQIKSAFVDADPFEENIRKALNFGHTIGHAIESHYLESDEPLLHGEAVAIGMAVETVISEKKGLLSSEKSKEILTVLHKLFELRVLPGSDIEHIIGLTAQDKKNKGDERKFVLLRDIGIYETDVSIDADMIRGAIFWYNNGMGYNQ